MNMIINTGARTDIPAFFSGWFFNRIKEGFVCVRNPYYQEQVTKYKLTPDVVDCIIFCTKNPRPMLPRIQELDAFSTYFFVTITPYGTDIEPHVPLASQVMADFQKLAMTIGKEKLCWRYDPIFINNCWTVERHVAEFAKMAKVLSGYTDDCVISFIDLYEKTKRNFVGVREVCAEEKRELAKEFSEIGRRYGIVVKTCAEAADLREFGVQLSGCITKDVMERAIGTSLKNIPQKPNRSHCGCIPNHDIGAYNTCPHGCKYCYANYNQETVRQNMQLHNPNSPLLIGQLSSRDTVRDARQESYVQRQMMMLF